MTDKEYSVIPIADLYDSVLQYANERALSHTLAVLPLTKELMSSADITVPDLLSGKTPEHLILFRHSLMVARMLIDLHNALPHDEEDVIIAAAVCHILPETHTFSSITDDLALSYGLDPRISEILTLTQRRHGLSDAQKRDYYDSIAGNKLAMLMKLADRADLLTQLHTVSSWSAREYAYETRAYFFPMCIYAREHYPELNSVISVLIEKMRSLIEVTEILLSRYEAKELELSREIIDLKEENSRIRGIIRKLSKTQ